MTPSGFVQRAVAAIAQISGIKSGKTKARTGLCHPAKGAFWFAPDEGGLSGELFVELLDKMMQGRKKVCASDRRWAASTQKSVVSEYVERTEGALTLHFLPDYPPDPNPDELIWSHSKRSGVARSPLKAGERLRCRVEAQLQDIADDKELIRSFFRHPSVSHITDWIVTFARILKPLPSESSMVMSPPLIPDQAVERVAAYFRALSDPTRLRILIALRDHEHSVGELTERVHCS